MPTIGLFNLMLPVDPRNGASNAKMPPSLATSQYPLLSLVGAMPTIGGDGGSLRQTAVWLAVRLSVALEVVHDGSSSQAGVHETTRQESLPTQATSWPHCPYRNVRHPVRRLLQS